MIFVTVGTQLSFDRMVRTIDQWAGSQSVGEVFAQIGPAHYRPQHIPCAEFLDADEFRRKIEQADVVVAHAGMGSILTALELAKPIVVMPRLSALGEHRNDHQLATAKRFLAQGRIIVAFDENQLLEKLNYLKSLRPADRIDGKASATLLTALRSFVAGEQPDLSAVIQPQDANLAHRARRARSTEKFRNGASHEQAANGSGFRTHAPHSVSRRTVSAAHIKARLAGVILLAGRLRTTDLGRRSGRSRLDLPVDEERTLLGYWRDEAIELAGAWKVPDLEMRVLVDQASPVPNLPPALPGVTISVERDRAEFRGTGGVLRDACADYDDDQWMLVANAAQMLFDPVRQFADALADAGGEINVVDDKDGIPNGLILLRCGALRSVAEIGFHDMKEQVIPSLAREHAVKVVSSLGMTSRPIHTLRDFTDALRRYHSREESCGSGEGRTGDPSNERWMPRFSIREQGSMVAPTAVISDAIVLQGGVVEKGAVVVRSIVCGGARVGAGQTVCDEIVN